jgi:hypothetical protein
MPLENEYSQLGAGQSAKTETSLGGHYAKESSRNNSCTNRVKEAQMIALGAQEQ